MHKVDITYLEKQIEELETKNFNLEKQFSHLQDLHAELELNYQENLKKGKKSRNDKQTKHESGERQEKPERAERQERKKSEVDKSEIKKNEKDASVFITKIKNDENEETSSKNSISPFENKIIQSRKMSSTRERVEFVSTTEVKEISHQSPVVTVKPRRDIVEFNKTRISRSKYPDYSKIK